MKELNDVRKRIIDLMKEKNITLSELAYDSKIAYSTLYNLITGKTKSIKIDTLLSICRGLGIELGAFFSEQSFKNKKSSYY